MNRKMLFIIVGILVICPFFILAFSSFNTVENLLIPPKLLGEYGDIQKAFEQSIKDTEKVSLKYPSKGDYRNAYVMYDVDKDGQDEVLVFYTVKSDETVVHASILDKSIYGDWKVIEDITGSGREINSVSFKDMDKSNSYEILISWSLYDSKSSKVLSVYKVNAEENQIIGLQTLAQENYSFYDLVDLDSDGYEEIFIAELDILEEIPTSYAKLLKLNNNKLETLSKMNLDGSVSSYSSLKVQHAREGSPTMIFLDAFKGNKQMITEVICWDSINKTLKVPFLDMQTLSNFATLRTPAVESMDIDNDGKIEIPIVANREELKELDNNYNTVESEDVICSITNWCSVENDKLKIKHQSVVNMRDLYILFIDKNIKDEFMAKNSIKSRKLTVYTNTEKVEDREKVFSILTAPIEEWTKNPIEGYCLLKRNKSLIYAYKIEKAGKRLGITPEKLAPGIRVLK